MQVNEQSTNINNGNQCKSMNITENKWTLLNLQLAMSSIHAVLQFCNLAKGPAAAGVALIHIYIYIYTYI